MYNCWKKNVKNNVKWPLLFELFQFNYCCKIWTKIVNQKHYTNE